MIRSMVREDMEDDVEYIGLIMVNIEMDEFLEIW